MSDSPQTPKMPNQRLHEEYEDPHYHDDDEVEPVEDNEPHATPPIPPRAAGGDRGGRRKWTYRPRRRFEED
jgi:hypothetical protein